MLLLPQYVQYATMIDKLQSINLPTNEQCSKVVCLMLMTVLSLHFLNGRFTQLYVIRFFICPQFTQI